MVGASHDTQKEPYHLKSQELVLANHAQFWYQVDQDKFTGNDFWRKAIIKEMSKIKIAWKVDDGHTPSEARASMATEFVGFQEVGCHLIFDVKMDFTRKARFVTGGHTM